MNAEDSFRIIVSHGAAAHAARSPVIEPAAFDPAAVRGAVDMIIDGRPLFPQPNEDSVFFLMRDLLTAADRLTTGDNSARVSFYEAPFELTLQRNGATVYLTLYRSGHAPEVLVKDHRVPCRHLWNAVADAADALLSHATTHHDGADDDPLVAWMRSASTRLREAAATTAARGQATPLPKKVIESSRWLVPRTDDGFSFGFRLTASWTDLLSPHRPIANDLNALLFRGRLAVHARERRRVLGEGYLFLQVEKLLHSLDRLLTAWEERRPMSVRLITEGLQVGIRLRADDALTITLADPRNAEEPLTLTDATVWEYADAVLGLAREVRRTVLATAPKQRRNTRMDALSRTIRHLASVVKEQRQESIINRDAAAYRTVAPTPRSDPSPPIVTGAMGLAFRERWRLEVEGLDLAGCLLVEQAAVVHTHNAMIGVDAATGTVLWRRDIDRHPYRAHSTGRGGIIRVTQPGVVDMVDAATGALRWQTHLAPRSGGAPVVLPVDHGAVPGLAVVAESDRHLVGLDLRTGEMKWRYSASRGGRFGLRRKDRLLYVTAGDTQLHAVDLAFGELVWRVTERTRFLHPPAVHGDAVFAVGGRLFRKDGVLCALDAYTGQKRWERRLDGGAHTTPLYSDGVLMVPVSDERRTWIAAFDANEGTPLWTLPYDGWADACALQEKDGRFYFNLAGGVLRCIDAHSGKEVWTAELGPTCSDDVPRDLSVHVRAGALFVPGDTVYLVDPETGKVLHSLGGTPPVPDKVIVTPDCSLLVAEESGHLGMYELARALTVLPGGA